MGSFEYRDAVSVIQIAVFPIFLWLGLKFKNEQKPGWFGIGFLSLCRIIGGSCMLALISRNTRGLWAAVLVCEAIGFLLLVFLLLELLEKINNAANLIHKKVFLIPQLIAYVDLAVSVPGFVMVGKRNDALAPTAYSRVGIVLNAVIYFGMVGTFVALFWWRSRILETEKSLLMCVAVCIPLLAIRLIYALIYVITAQKFFNAIVGNPSAYMLMTTFPEIAVVGICTWVILKLVLTEGRKEVELEDVESGRSVPGEESQSK